MRAARAARGGTVSLRSVWLNMQLTSLYLAFLIGSLEATQQGASWAPDAHQQLQYDDDEQDEDSDERPPGPGVDPLSGWWGGR